MSNYFKLNVIKTNKIPYAITYVKFNTSQKSLLFSLNVKFKLENNNPVNTKNNFIQKIYTGTSGIMFISQENRSLNIVSKYITYILRKHLKNNQYYGTTESNYNQLHTDILKGCELTIISVLCTLLIPIP